MAKESDLEKWCRLRAEERGCRLPKWVSPGNRGVPNRILFAPHGFVVFIEFKRPGEKLDPLQKKWNLWMHDNGHIVEMVRTRKEFISILNACFAGLAV